MRLPLESFTVERFRGIRDLELRDLGRFNLLVGRNNSGKTSVLEALSVFCAPLDPWKWMGVASWREPFGGSTVVERFRWLFPQTREQELTRPYDGMLSVVGVGRAPVREVVARYQELRGTEVVGAPSARVGEVAVGERRGARVEVAVKTRQMDLFTGEETRGSFTFWERERFEAPPQPVEPAVPFRAINPSAHWLGGVRDFSEAKLAGHWDETIALLKKIEPTILGAELLVPPWASDNSPTVYLRDERAGLLPLGSYGDGIRRALHFALTIPSVAGGVLLIDELETAIHVSALEHVFRWLLDACVTHDVQVFATTHSLEALDAILAVDPTPEEDIVAYRLEREGEQTTARRYGEDLLKRIRYERGLDVR
ncbi:ATP-binding protein [Polyangium sp. y55x31]|uniref:AAA family ATPase n=1 Tax=Polyangium sp. y55x31 TaxID=3042688 RepID=UPI002482B8F1|nr:ATP-binding protein [Polyangium sp. y55x31]MDI1481815.1 AAA family ATPase [Polyangium sp. y55x31]